MIRRIENYSELWERADWKQFQKVLFRLQHRVRTKQLELETWVKARNIQKLILKSHSSSQGL